MQRVRDGPVLYPQRQVGAVDLQGPLKAVQHGLRVFPYGNVTFQLVGVELFLNTAGPSESHTCPGVKPEETYGSSFELSDGTWCKMQQNKPPILIFYLPICHSIPTHSGPLNSLRIFSKNKLYMSLKNPIERVGNFLSFAPWAKFNNFCNCLHLHHILSLTNCLFSLINIWNQIKSLNEKVQRVQNKMIYLDDLYYRWLSFLGKS